MRFYTLQSLNLDFHGYQFAEFPIPYGLVSQTLDFIRANFYNRISTYSNFQNVILYACISRNCNSTGANFQNSQFHAHHFKNLAISCKLDRQSESATLNCSGAILDPSINSSQTERKKKGGRRGKKGRTRRGKVKREARRRVKTEKRVSRQASTLRGLAFLSCRGFKAGSHERNRSGYPYWIRRNEPLNRASVARGTNLFVLRIYRV